MCSDLGIALKNENVRLISQYIQQRYSLVVSDTVVLSMCIKALKGKHGCGSWTDQTWDLWLRKRMDETHSWHKTKGEIDDDAQTARMHCFFLTLEETEEMIARLRNETKTGSKVARSKISKTPLEINPIDIVAHRVTKE